MSAHTTPTLRDQGRALLRFVRPYRAWLIAAFCATVVGAALGLAFPWVMGTLVDAAFLADGSTSALNRAAMVLLVVFVAQAAASSIRIRSLAHAGQHVVNDLRDAIFEQVLRLPVSFLDRHTTGALTARLMADAAMVYSSASGAAPQAVYALITVIGGSVLLILISPLLATVVLLLLPVASIVARRYGNSIRSVSRDYQSGLASANALAVDALSSFRIVKWFSAGDSIASEYRSRLDDVVGQGIDRARVRSFWTPGTTLITSIGVIAVVWIGGRQVQDGAMTPGALVSFLLYARIVATGISSLVDQWSRLANAMGASERIFGLLDEPVEGETGDDHDAISIPVREGAVRFSDVSFAYPGREGVVLHHIDLAIRAGETVALVGPSGAGKSTLTELIGRFYDPDTGAVFVDGVDVRCQSLTDLRMSIAIVPQEVMLLSGSIAQNLRLGKPDATKTELVEAARTANAHGFIRSFPRGYGTRIGERGTALSGGQRQRIAIARAILADPKLLILDEATNALDPETELLVQEALDRLMAGRTNLVIAHRLSTVRSADRVIVLDRGRIVEEGPPDELLRGGGPFARMARLELSRS